MTVGPPGESVQSSSKVQLHHPGTLDSGVDRPSTHSLCLPSINVPCDSATPDICSGDQNPLLYFFFQMTFMYLTNILSHEVVLLMFLRAPRQPFIPLKNKRKTILQMWGCDCVLNNGPRAPFLSSISSALRLTANSAFLKDQILSRCHISSGEGLTDTAPQGWSLRDASLLGATSQLPVHHAAYWSGCCAVRWHSEGVRGVPALMREDQTAQGSFPPKRIPTCVGTRHSSQERNSPLRIRSLLG